MRISFSSFHALFALFCFYSKRETNWGNQTIEDRNSFAVAINTDFIGSYWRNHENEQLQWRRWKCFITFLIVMKRACQMRFSPRINFIHTRQISYHLTVFCPATFLFTRMLKFKKPVFRNVLTVLIEVS